MKKYLLIGLLLLTMTLVACGSEKAKDTDLKNPATDQTVEEVPNDTEDPVEPDNTEEPVEPDDTDEAVNPDDTEDPVKPEVEMVDFETWAKQEGNNDVCLVIWNEELNIQEVMLTLGKSGKAHKVQEGDRFAIPYRENIKYVNLLHENGELDILGWKNGAEYMEVEIPIGENVDFYIDYENENGEVKTLSYAFK